MPRLSLPNVVVAVLLREAKAMSLDLLARVSVLEGITGKKPGTWIGNVVPEREIVEVFGPKVNATWLSPRDSGLQAAVRRSLEPLLRNTTTTGPTADDILQPAIVGLGASGELWRMPLFYGVGKARGFTVAKVKAGSLGPRDVLPVAKSYARGRAIDVLRTQARRPGIERIDGDELYDAGGVAQSPSPCAGGAQREVVNALFEPIKLPDPEKPRCGSGANADPGGVRSSGSTRSVEHLRRWCHGASPRTARARRGSHSL